MRRSYIFATLILTAMTFGLARSGLAQDALTAVTDASFDTVVLKAQKPVVVVVLANWCGPCRITMSSASSVQTELKGQVLFATLNTDASSMTASKLGVQSIPTVLMFRNGKLLDRQIGAASKETLSTWIHQTLGKPN